MKKKLFNSLKKALPIVAIGLCLASCDKLLEVKPDNALEPEQFYQNRFDADAAVIGIYGKFLGLAEHHLVLNELRADMMDVTPAAREGMVQLSQHSVTPDNIYANPRPYYELIVLCNDALRNFERMNAESKMLPDEFNQRFSDIATLRSWLYMQLAIHFGQVRYITDPLTKITDVSDLNRFPLYDLDQMLNELIKVMESLPTLEQYPQLGSNVISPTIDGQNTRKMFINKRVFLGDLYLWNGQYRQAAEQYKLVMVSPGSVTGATDQFNSYKVKWADVTNHQDLSVGYVRYADQDLYSLINTETQGWKSMFIRNQDALFNEEWIWVLPFDYRFNQQTPFVKLFSPIGGDYLIKPSQQGIDMWESQVQRNGFPWDQRGRWSWALQNGQPAVIKHTYNFNPVTPLQTQGKWFMYRAALLHLRFAEAANRDPIQDVSETATPRRVAWALLNMGGAAAFNESRALQETFLPFPYNFAFRPTSPTSPADLWHRNAGIRGRANLTYHSIPEGLENEEDEIRAVEDKIIEEVALELGFEGHRWGDLLRIAKRRNDPSFLADKIRDKLLKSGNPGAAAAAHAKLMNREWFLPFNWQ